MIMINSWDDHSLDCFKDLSDEISRRCCTFLRGYRLNYLPSNSHMSLLLLYPYHIHKIAQCAIRSVSRFSHVFRRFSALQYRIGNMNQ